MTQPLLQNKYGFASDRSRTKRRY